MRAAATATLIAVLLLTPLAQARNFARSYTASADRAFDAILQLVEKDPRVRLIDMDIPRRIIHFRLALDPASPPNPRSASTSAPFSGDQFSGMYVLLQVSADRDTKAGQTRAMVNVTADRIYPLGAGPHDAKKAHSDEENAYAKDFLRKLQMELKSK
jgi:hypothetical protein